jgi:magnesium transporter
VGGGRSTEGGIVTEQAGAGPAPPVPSARIVRWTPDGTTESTDLSTLADLLADPEARIWVDIVDADAATVDAAARALGIHPLVAEDIAERNQRAKVEATDGIIHVVLFGVAYAGEVRMTEVDLVLGERFILSAHDGTWQPDGHVIRRGAEAALARGPDFVLYAIADAIVDGYFPVLDRVEDEIDRLQDDVLSRPTQWTLERVFRLKRELIELRRAVSPSREVFNQLTNRELALVSPELLIYFRDVYDHLIRVTDELDNDREQVAGALDVYLSSINNNLSTIMKRLTGVTVILAGIGAVAGIFGMSEAGAALDGGEALGFWVVTLIVVVLAAAVAAFLRRIDWI